MSRVFGIPQYTSVSLLALAAAGAFSQSSQACEATDTGPAVSVFCNLSSSGPFATSYTDSPYETYDGGGDDTVTVSGGNIDPDLPPPVVDESASLDSSSNVETLAGDDTVNISSSRIGRSPDFAGPEQPATRIDVLLGDGNDIFNASGGDVYGAVFGGAGVDAFSVSGGTIWFGLLGEEGTDIFSISGGEILGPVDGGADDDSIAIFDGNPDDDSTVELDSVAGGSGNDTVTIGNASITIVGGERTVTFGEGGGSVVVSQAAGGDGNDHFAVGGRASADLVDGGAGNDLFDIGGNALVDSLLGGDDDDAFNIIGEARVNSIEAGAGNDRITLSDDEPEDESAPVVDLIMGEGGSDTIILSGGQTLFVSGGAEDDNITVEGSALADYGESATSISGDGGNDTISVSGGAVLGDIELGDGNDTLVATDGAGASDGGTIGGDIFGGAGADSFIISAGTLEGSLFGQAGGNTFDISGGTIEQSIFSGSEDDVVIISGGANIVGSTADPDAIGLEDGDDQFTMEDGTVGAAVSGGSGVDHLRVEGGSIAGFLAGNAGSDIIVIAGGEILGGVQGNEDDDSIDVSGGSAGDVTGDEGNDAIVIRDAANVQSLSGGAGADAIWLIGGTISGDVSGNLGSDTIVIVNGEIFGGVQGNEDDDSINVSGGSVGGVTGNDGDDTISVSGSAEIVSVEGGAGSDTVNVTGGEILHGVQGNDGDDSFDVSGGSAGDVTGDGGDDAIAVGGTANVRSIAGGAGADSVAVSGGAVSGDIDAETVILTGGRIGGDITGLSDSTLVIDDGAAPAALILRDGVLFSGADAIGTITDINLAAGGRSQNFAGFASLGLDSSTLRFIGGTQVIDSLALANGSTLFSTGATRLGSQGDGFGDLSLVNSTLTMINGDPTDTLTLGGLVLNGSTVGLDVNQVTEQADRILANGFVTADGANVILVNLLGTPNLSDATDILILTGSGAPIGGTFVVEGITGTPAALFDYTIVQGPDGALILRASPNSPFVGVVSAVDAAAAAQTSETMLEAFFSVTDDAAEYGLGLTGAAPVAVSSTFGVFASGQFARVGHDGFSISDGMGGVGAGPSFTSDDFSAAISLDWNAAKHFGFDQQYGLNLGVFAGYTSTNLELNSFGGFDHPGWASNESGMVGLYSLLRRQQSYLLVSGMALIGGTDVWNGMLGGVGGHYDTLGYAVSASAGRVFALSERVRFDLRGGVLGVNFEGEDYTDSLGVEHGESSVSFGAVKFEPGLYADHVLENGMVFSPYVRLDLQQRFGYENSASSGGREFDFDDEDFSAALMAGFNMRVSPSSTVSAEIRGKSSADSHTLAGKFGFKVAF